MADLNLLSIGLINDMYAESRNDDCNHATLIAHEDFNKFLARVKKKVDKQN